MSATPGWDVEIKSTPLERVSRRVLITRPDLAYLRHAKIDGDACPGVALISFAYAPATGFHPLRDKEGNCVTVILREAGLCICRDDEICRFGDRHFPFHVITRNYRFSFDQKCRQSLVGEVLVAWGGARHRRTFWKKVLA